MRFVWGIILGIVCIFLLFSCTPKSIMNNSLEKSDNRTFVDSIFSIDSKDITSVSYKGYQPFAHMMGFWSTLNYAITYDVTREVNGETQQYTLIEKRNSGFLQTELTSDNGKRYFYFVDAKTYECDSFLSSAVCNSIKYEEVTSPTVFLEFTDINKIEELNEEEVLNEKVLCGYGGKTTPCLSRGGLPLKVAYYDGANRYIFLATSYDVSFNETISFPQSISSTYS